MLFIGINMQQLRRQDIFTLLDSLILSVGREPLGLINASWQGISVIRETNMERQAPMVLAPGGNITPATSFNYMPPMAVMMELGGLKLMGLE